MAPHPGTSRETSITVLACLLLLAAPTGIRAGQVPSEPISLFDGRVRLSADVTATIGAPDNDAFFNYTDYERNALRTLRTSLSGIWTAGGRIAVVAGLWLAAGGLTFPGVAQSFWILMALGLNAAELSTLYFTGPGSLPRMPAASVAPLPIICTNSTSATPSRRDASCSSPGTSRASPRVHSCATPAAPSSANRSCSTSSPARAFPSIDSKAWSRAMPFMPVTCPASFSRKVTSTEASCIAKVVAEVG